MNRRSSGNGGLFIRACNSAIIRAIVTDWVAYLRTEKLWGLDDPLFPATRVAVGGNCRFEAAGLDRKHWTNAGPIRTVFRQAFAAAGLSYFNPHSFRKTLAQIGGRLCHTPRGIQSVVAEFGARACATTFTSYGNIDSNRQAEIIRAMT